MPKMRWPFQFEKQTSFFERAHAKCPPGRMPLLCGVDGRHEGVARRFPGFIKYPDSTFQLREGSAGDATDDADFDPDQARYFQIQKERGSSDKIRGFVVGDYTDGTLEIWYRFSDDTAGVLRKHTPVVAEPCITSWDGTSTGIPGWGFFKDADSFIGQTITHYLRVQNAFCQTDADGVRQMYVVGLFRRAGGRNCHCVARYNGTQWEVMGEPFDGPVLCITGDPTTKTIYVGGFFLTVGGQTCKRIAKWNGASWEEYGGGANSTVIAIAHDGTRVWVGGIFTQVGGDTSATSKLAYRTDAVGESWTGFDGAWTGSGSGQINRLLFAGASGGPINDAMFVMGGFSQINGLARAHITYVDVGEGGGPATLVDMDGGLNDEVWEGALVGTAGSEDLYVVGEFSTIVDGAVGTKSGTAVWTSADPTKFQKVADTVLAGAFKSIAVADVGSGDQVFVGRTSGDPRLFYLSGSIPTGTWNPVAAIDDSWDSLRLFQPTGTFEVDPGTPSGDNPRLFLFNQQRSPATSAEVTAGPFSVAGSITWDVATRGNYLYLMSSLGQHFTLSWDVSASTWKIEEFGPGFTQLPPCFVGDEAAGGGFRLQEGNYNGAYRFFDSKRLRYSVLSPQSLTQATSVGLAIPWLYFMELHDVTTGTFVVPTLFLDNGDVAIGEYDRFEAFSTISSGDEEVEAGGFLYSAFKGTKSTLENTAIAIGGTRYTDIPGPQGSNPKQISPLGDLAMVADPTGRYDYALDEVGELSQVVAVLHTQGATYALEDRDGFLDLKWSPLHREEPENFPTANVYPTKIPTGDAATCRIIAVGDYIYVFGADLIYRAQRMGSRLAIVELHQGFPIIHRLGITRVGTRVYAVTKRGLLVLDGRSGQARIMPELYRVFYDRWRGSLNPGSHSTAVSLAYDSAMDCLFMHHRSLHETICLWLTTGKVTVLPYSPYEVVLEGPDLDSGITTRAYFLTARRSLSSVNVDGASSGTQPQTMSGLLLYDGTSSTVTYNEILTDHTIATTKITFAGAKKPFTTDGTGGAGTARLDLKNQYVALMTAAGSWAMYKISTNDDNSITLTSNPGAVAADVISLSPVVFMCLGAPLWVGNGRPDTLLRKFVEGQTVVVARTGSGTGADSGGQALTTPLGSTWGFLGYGATRNTAVVSQEPKTSDLDKLVADDPAAQLVARANNATGALDVDTAQGNWAYGTRDGNLLYPWVVSLYSNYWFEMYLWLVSGSVEATELPGEA